MCSGIPERFESTEGNRSKFLLKQLRVWGYKILNGILLNFVRYCLIIIFGTATFYSVFAKHYVDTHLWCSARRNCVFTS
jgi:hypothetical protein